MFPVWEKALYVSFWVFIGTVSFSINVQEHKEKLLLLEKSLELITSRDQPKSAPYPRLKNSKRTSKSQFTVLENRKSKKTGPSGAPPGPASASPWRAKRGKLPKLSTFLSELKRGPFGEKTNFRKKCRKTERGTLWDF